MKDWSELLFWKSGEWQVIEERLDAADVQYCPSRDCLFRALDLCPFSEVKVAIIGQDPYPNPAFATGLAFSVPDTVPVDKLPPSLKTIFREYVDDLHLPFPSTGDLTPWCNQGILLWNAIPTTEAGRPAAHRDWTEWGYLTKELIECLGQREDKSILFCFVGSIAREYSRYVKVSANTYYVGHPSPRASYRSNNPFTGSRFFSHIKNQLVSLGHSEIDWRLS